MADFPFTPVRVLPSAGFAAARYVAFGGPTRSRIGRMPTVQKMALLHNEVRVKWRCLVTRLFDAGCPMINTKTKLQYFRNCPPVGFSTDYKSRCCTCPLLCPFCYARQNVVAVYDKFREALWRVKKGKRVKDGLCLVEFSGRVLQKDMEALVHAAGKDDTPRNAFEFAINRAKIMTAPLFRLRESRRLEYVKGGVILHRVSYPQHGLPVIMRSGLFMVTKGAKVDFGKRNSTFKFSVHENITQRMVSRALARIARYQSGWLFRASDEELCDYLRIMKGTRMMSMFGMLWNLDTGI